MEEWTKVDIAKTAATARRAMVVLPFGKTKKAQKIVVGDMEGSISSYSLKKGETEMNFKTLPASRGISRMVLDGPIGAKTSKVYTASGSSVSGIDRKKGKEVYRFQTPMTEVLHGLTVEGTSIWASGEFVYSSFVDCDKKDFSESGYLMAPDAIADLLITAGPGETRTPVLACSDGKIRTVSGSNVVSETAVQGRPSALIGVPNDGSTSNPIIYGTEDGSIGLLKPEQSDGGATTLVTGWTIPAEKTSARAVQTFSLADVTGNGSLDVVVGRHDGFIGVYAASGDGGAPSLRASRDVGESVTCVDTGLISSMNTDDIVMSTYGGSLSVLTTEPWAGEQVASAMAPVPDPYSSADIIPKVDAKTLAQGRAGVVDKQIADLKAEIDKLKTKLTKDRTAYDIHLQAHEKEEKRKSATATNLPGFTRSDSGNLRTIPQSNNQDGLVLSQDGPRTTEADLAIVSTSRARIPILTDFSLKPGQSAYSLAVEIDRPLEMVVVKSTVPLDLIPDLTGPASVSIPPGPDPLDGAGVWKAIFKFPEEGPGALSKKLETQLRVLEGQSGLLTLVVIPRGIPSIADTVVLPLKPLAMHRRLQATPEERQRFDSTFCRPLEPEITNNKRSGATGGPPPAPESSQPAGWPDRAYSKIKVTGTFSLTDAHAWISSCVPSLPDKPPVNPNGGDDQNVCFLYESALLGTVILLKYRRGMISISSDNLSALTIFKDSLSRSSTARNIMIRMEPEISEVTLEQNLWRLHAQLGYQLGLSKKVSLLAGLRELTKSTTKDPSTFLSDTLVTILKQADRLEQELKVQPKAVAYLVTMTTELFVNRFKLRSSDVKSRVPALTEFLKSPKYSHGGLMEVFRTGKVVNN